MRPRLILMVVGASFTIFGTALVPSMSSALAQTQIDEIVERAEKGDAESQYILGDMYRYGVIVMSDGSRVRQNGELAIKWLRKAAEQNLRSAQFMLGEILYESDLLNGINADEIESAKWLARFLRCPLYQTTCPRPADLDDKSVAAAEFMLGVMFYQECDPYWERARPDVILLSECPREGRHLKQDYRNAARYFRSAAEAGHPAAQYQLARMYQTGKGVPQDYVEAAKWYRSAAEGDLQGARGPLGELYVKMGDHVAAHMWFNLAVIADDPWAAKARDEIAKVLTPAQIAEAQKMARVWDEGRKK